MNRMYAADCKDSTCLQNGLHLRLGYYPLFPYFVPSKGPNGEDFLKGIAPELVLPFLFGSQNITYSLLSSPTADYSNKLDNGTWIADFGLLQSREVDINLGPQYNDFQRFEDFASLDTYQFFCIIILASVGKNEVYDFFKFLYKVDSLVWYILVLSFATLIFLSALCENINKGLFTKMLMKLNISRCFWTYLAALFCEGSPRTMSTAPSKVLQMIWLFVVLVFMTGLVGQFKAILMVKHEDDIIKTVDDLAAKPHMIPLMVENTIFDTVFRDSSIDTYQKIYKQAMLRRKEVLISLEQYVALETYQKVKDGKAVLLTVEVTTKSILSRMCYMLKGSRRLYFSEETFYPFNMVYFINYDFPTYLRDKINERISRMKENGFYDKWYSEMYKDYDKCQEEFQQKEEASLRFKHLEQAFYLLGVCHVCSFVVFFWECSQRIRKCFKRCKK